MKTIVVLFSLLMVILISSCQSQSGHKVPTRHFEKVVIIDNKDSVKTDMGTAYQYKVKRLSKGVVTYVTVVGLYERNDTIMYSFLNDF